MLIYTTMYIVKMYKYRPNSSGCLYANSVTGYGTEYPVTDGIASMSRRLLQQEEDAEGRTENKSLEEIEEYFEDPTKLKNSFVQATAMRKNAFQVAFQPEEFARTGLQTLNVWIFWIACIIMFCFWGSTGWKVLNDMWDVTRYISSFNNSDPILNTDNSMRRKINKKELGIAVRNIEDKLSIGLVQKR